MIPLMDSVKEAFAVAEVTRIADDEGQRIAQKQNIPYPAAHPGCS